MADRQRVLVLFNPKAGISNRRVEPRELEAALSAAGAEPRIVQLDRRPVAKLLAEYDPRAEALVVAGGGDGTLRSIAEALVGTDRPLGVVPLGTRNHFARDVGLPLGLDESIESLLQPHIGAVDTGEIDGRLFLNNASLGLYPGFVEERRRRARATARWSAIAGAAWWVLNQRRRLRIRIDGDDPETRASIVFIGNNRYRIEGFGLGQRVSLDRGELMLVLAAPTGPWSATRLLLRAVLGRLEDERGYRHQYVRSAVIDTRRSTVRVALDGEPQRFRPPLHVRIRPASLRLRGLRSA